MISGLPVSQKIKTDIPSIQKASSTALTQIKTAQNAFTKLTTIARETYKKLIEPRKEIPNTLENHV